MAVRRAAAIVERCRRHDATVEAVTLALYCVAYGTLTIMALALMGWVG
jgi:hypothetical protein